MASSSSPFDASASAVGYLYQCRYALLLALQKGDDIDLGISVERLDDVAFHQSPLTPDTARELLQFKHHIGRRGTLGDTSPDVWKSLNLWVEAAQSGRIDLKKVTLCLVTTSQATQRNAIRLLRPDPASRKPLEALDSLLKAGAASTDSTVTGAFARISSLCDAERRALIEAVVLLDGASSAIDLEGALRNALRYAAEPRHQDALLERLEGWWLQRLLRHLSDHSSGLIPVSLIQQKVYEIGGMFRRECLPDDLSGTTVPDEAIPDGDDRHFIRQLRLIGVSQARLRYAQADHYRAFTQRSRWVKEQLLGLEETMAYETRLVDAWSERFEIMREGLQPGVDHPVKASHGHRFYEWIVSEAPARGSFWIRPDFQAEYMTKGSYHMLADVLRVGWHPDYVLLLARPKTMEEENSHDGTLDRATDRGRQLAESCIRRGITETRLGRILQRSQGRYALRACFPRPADLPTSADD